MKFEKFKYIISDKNVRKLQKKNVVKMDEIDGKTGCSNGKLRKFMFTICKSRDHHIMMK